MIRRATVLSSVMTIIMDAQWCIVPSRVSYPLSEGKYSSPMRRHESHERPCRNEGNRVPRDRVLAYS